MRAGSDVPFLDRYEAGKLLASELRAYVRHSDAIVLALPRGGVPVGFEVAQALDLPLDVFLVRKLGVPGHEELAMGAIASGGIRVLNPDIVKSLAIPPETIEWVAAREGEELARREREYRDDRPPVHFHGRTVILVDDGLATGSTMRAAVTALRREEAAHIVVAVPVGAPEACDSLRHLGVEVICLQAPREFYAVGEWYYDFRPTSDAEVRDLLARDVTRGRSHYANRD
jgi:predicted phosphoribosyltransferase